MSCQQSAWPVRPLSPQLTVYSDRYHAGPVVPSAVRPVFYNRQISAAENRTFFMNRSVFDLVDDHLYISLTDPKLLGWYHGLSPEDRQIIDDGGGFHKFLQRHPALKVSRHHVYVKYNPGRTSPGSTCPGPATMPSNTHEYYGTRARDSRFGNAHVRARLEFEMLSSNSQETVTQRHCGSNIHSREEICHLPQTEHLQDGLQTALSSSIMQEPKYEDTPSWHMTGRISPHDCSVDTELDRCRWGAESELSSQTAVTQDWTTDITYAEVGPLQSEWAIPESTSLKSADGDEGGLRFDEKRENLLRIMEDNQSTVVCPSSEDVTAHSGEVHSGSVITNNEALAAGGETLKSGQSVIQVDTAEKCTTPCVTTCDAVVGTEPELCVSVFTQTESPGTSDKHVITEVHMEDLDYLTEEFIKLRKAKEQLRAQEEKMKSLLCKLKEKCECNQRAQRAELSLLALQYSMCRQHCWRLHLTAAEGDHFTSLPKSPPNITSVLQKLESDYHQMKDNILSGVPLEELQPLSVGSEKITRGASYIPAQIADDVLGNDPPWSSREPEKHRTSDSQSRNGCQDGGRKEEQMKKDNGKARRAVTLVPQAPAECKELKTSEAWYDAQEDLDPAGPAAAAGAGQDPTVNPEDMSSAAPSAGEDGQSSVLSVSNLPNDVKESDVMLWFEKYQVSEVRICALRDDLRVAIVTMSGPQSAEAALRELNGFTVQGRTLHVEHVNTAIGGSQNQASASVSGPGSLEDASKPQKTKADSTNTYTQFITPPSFSSTINNRKVVCMTPTAKGTCVPQHFGTMGGFDTLMAELASHHPDVGRERIVDALMELIDEHKGVLSSLPLTTIREMTSKLLTGGEGATQS